MTLPAPVFLFVILREAVQQLRKLTQAGDETLTLADRST